ncbi:predicted protein [Verticillium alfalfae VaMs.102]|uniref:Predicted protein n=1 Tax=Verticillium alfalfae (strain VaMs.102 / ATCC MYA-4576 / FGSC 10136) TaxID=526221 RepID=C9SRH2_VERA1|nr:predicted protein [Verticillium alfalfae VaMs.102]EEY21387.1 predicted protein [Verticillium alfalfae VaMs.102]
MPHTWVYTPEALRALRERDEGRDPSGLQIEHCSATSYEARLVFAKNAQRTSRTSPLFQLEEEAHPGSATPRSCGVRGSLEGGENEEGQRQGTIRSCEGEETERGLGQWMGAARRHERLGGNVGMASVAQGKARQDKGRRGKRETFV